MRLRAVLQRSSQCRRMMRGRRVMSRKVGRVTGRLRRMRV
jgi:hypothetical protein